MFELSSNQLPGPTVPDLESMFLSDVTAADIHRCMGGTNHMVRMRSGSALAADNAGSEQTRPASRNIAISSAVSELKDQKALSAGLILWGIYAVA